LEHWTSNWFEQHFPAEAPTYRRDFKGGAFLSVIPDWAVQFHWVRDVVLWEVLRFDMPIFTDWVS
jgi:hypothetical protein